jgi:type II secretory pathway pseudopilin PulG
MLRSSQAERYLRVRRKEACGFTLIELVFVVFITMVLAAIADWLYIRTAMLKPTTLTSRGTGHYSSHSVTHEKFAILRRV